MKPSAFNIKEMAKKKLDVDVFLQKFLDTQKIHAKSLISTFFGDLAVPHGGKAWVEVISSLLEPLGVSNRLVRTSLFRLAEEQWLDSTRIGRKSYYQLSDKAIGQTNLAEKMIYYRHRQQWDGRWTLVFIVQRPPNIELRNQLEQELKWIGFGAVSKHVYAHPNASIDLVAERVSSLKLNKHVICMRAENICDAMAGLDVTDSEMAAMCFPSIGLEKNYINFIKLFSQLKLESIGSASKSDLLMLRLLLIDEYRRIVLHDPHLPDVLLPKGWVGDEAHSLCKTIYQSLLTGSDKAYRELFKEQSTDLLSDFISEYENRFQQ